MKKCFGRLFILSFLLFVINAESFCVFASDKINLNQIDKYKQIHFKQITVKKGDNLHSIADKYKTTIKDIQLVNNMKTINLKLGQNLVVPLETKIVIIIYKVKKNETLSKIVISHKTNEVAIRKINNLKTSKIKNGQVLKIPVKVIKSLPAPTVSIPKIVTSNTVSQFGIKGHGKPYAIILFQVKDKKNKVINYSIKTNNTGLFNKKINLKSLSEGNLFLEVSQKDNDGIQSKKIILPVLKDTIGPIHSENSTSEVIYNNQKSFEIKGRTEPYSTIRIIASDGKKTVNFNSINANDKGMFATYLDVTALSDGKIFFSVVSLDKYGNQGFVKKISLTKNSKTYLLDDTEKNKWNIYDNGIHSVETTEGFNNALKWANENGILIFKVPPGVYLIKKDQPINSYTPDTTARINMVSNMIFELDPNATIQKETNGLQGYATLFIGEGIHNVTIRGGTYKGDRYTHDYSSGGTHEGGIGILTAGARNVTIENVKTIDFTGDGICLCGGGKQIDLLYSSDFESGSIDDNGNLIPDSSKIRTKNILKTNFNHPAFQKTRTIHFSLAQNLPKDGPFDLYFYKKDGTFLYSVKNQEVDWSLIEVPIEADYFRLVYHDNNLTNIQLQYWNKPVSEKVTVKNSETGFNRRQGITIAGGKDLVVMNNKIHDISGTAPESGIDIEGGTGGNGPPNMDIQILNNYFYNNNAYNVILYDGENVTVDGNYLGPDKDYTVGVTVSSLFRKGAVIKNNVFEGATLIGAKDATYLNNTVNNATAVFYGPNTYVDGLTFNNGSLAMRSTQPFGIDIQNVTFNNSDTSKGWYTLAIYDNPIHFKNITINGSLGLSTMFSNNVDGNIFENFKSYNHRGYDFAGGTYTNCVIESSTYSIGDVNDIGTYVFDGCQFKGNGSLAVKNVNSDVTIKNSSFTSIGDKELLSVESAKNIKILDNTFSANNLPLFHQSVIRLNNYFTKENPYDVLEATITGNIIYANSAIAGISTEYAGLGAPPYTISNNTLYNAKLKLRLEDIALNNLELTK